MLFHFLYSFNLFHNFNLIQLQALRFLIIPPRQFLKLLAFNIITYGKRDSLFTSSCCPSYSVDITHQFNWELIVNHGLNVRNVKTTSYKIRNQEICEISLSELHERLNSLLLGQVSMELSGFESGHTKDDGHFMTLFFSFEEDNGFLFKMCFNNVYQHSFSSYFIWIFELNIHLLQLSHHFVIWICFQSNWFLQGHVDDKVQFRWKGCREKHSLSIRI